MTQPCQLWPNHPWPGWLQTPLVILGLFLVGAWMGWMVGVMWTHYYHYKVEEWIHRNDP